MTTQHYQAVPQVSSDHYQEGYDSAKRWSSYWIQIEAALNSPEGKIMEVGIGSGVVADYLRKVGNRDVTTVDIDPELKPDVVADIANLPFEETSFSCVMACEVLEHMPFEQSVLALKELRRVGETAIISVPASDRVGELRVDFSFWRFRFNFQIPFPRFIPRKRPVVINEHYWEIGVKGYSSARLQNVIRTAGWTIVEDFRNPQHGFHHFYILK